MPCIRTNFRDASANNWARARTSTGLASGPFRFNNTLVDISKSRAGSIHATIRQRRSSVSISVGKPRCCQYHMSGSNHANGKGHEGGLVCCGVGHGSGCRERGECVMPGMASHAHSAKRPSSRAIAPGVMSILAGVCSHPSCDDCLWKEDFRLPPNSAPSRTLPENMRTYARRSHPAHCRNGHIPY